jgi:hypothetical protein
VVETTQPRQHYYGFARDAKGLKRLLRQVRNAQTCPIFEIRVSNRNQFSFREGPNQRVSSEEKGVRLSVVHHTQFG